MKEFQFTLNDVLCINVRKVSTKENRGETNLQSKLFKNKWL